MVIIDSQNVLKNRYEFSARGAGILGFSNFGRDHFYLLDKNMKIRAKELLTYLEKYKGEKILLFGFTFMIWKYLIEELKSKDSQLEIEDSILIHSGGWKKLQEIAVSNTIFKENLKKYLGINSVHNFYGMVEQVGGIYMECEKGYFHSPNFSDIIIRDYRDWNSVEMGQEAIQGIQY